MALVGGGYLDIPTISAVDTTFAIKGATAEEYIGLNKYKDGWVFVTISNIPLSTSEHKVFTLPADFIPSRYQSLHVTNYNSGSPITYKVTVSTNGQMMIAYNSIPGPVLFATFYYRTT